MATSSTLDLTVESDTDDRIEKLTKTPIRRRKEQTGIASSGPEPANISYEPQYLGYKPPVPPCAYVNTCKWGGRTFRVGDTVELSSNGNFLEIRHIIQDLEKDVVTLRGIRYKRNRCLGPLLPDVQDETCDMKNEVCMLLDVNADDDHPFATQGMIDVPVEEIKRKRRLWRTHLDFPALTTLKPDENHDPLVCRWIFIQVHEGADSRRRGRKSIEGVLRRVAERESNRSGFRSDASAKTVSRPTPQDLSASRGRRSFVDLTSEPSVKTVTEFEQRSRCSTSTGVYEQHVASIRTENFTPVGSSDELHHISKFSLGTESGPSTTRPTGFTVDDVFHSSRATKASAPTPSAKHMNSRKRPRSTPTAQRTVYTFADACCGAGGASRAAESAGFCIKWAVDKDETACESYRLNFDTTYVFPMNVGDLQALTDDLIVVHVHISPSCQPWSPAHTKRGKNDEENEAVLFSVGAIIRKARPRTVTLEETSGLFSGHKNTFYRLLEMICAEGYDVRYRVVDFADYGLCQHRKRLIILASR